MSFESIKSLSDKIGEEVSIRGWLHHVRRQGKLTFLVIRDATGYIQSVVKPASGEAATSVASKLTRETAVTATGVVKEDKRAPYNGLELQINNIFPVIDYASPELEYEIRPDSGPQVLLNKRHLVLRGEQAS
ncbi:MAG: OB-fold nucleic acid binding domain-containing protein, partial [Candidatus Hodarchaeales archaeon]